MRNISNALIVIVLLLSLVSCGGEKKQIGRLFTIQIENPKKGYAPDAVLNVSLSNADEKEVTKVIYSLGDDSQLAANSASETVRFPLSTMNMGRHTLTASITYEDGKGDVATSIVVLAPSRPKIYSYKILETYPHDITAYTQGLEFDGDVLYEGTGQYRESTLRKTDYKTGEVLKSVALEDRFFGEGITVVDDKIYQLTWRENMGFIYDKNTLTQEGSFNYNKSREGWGLANNGSTIFKSDGTEKIWKLDKSTLAEKEYIEVYTNKSKIDTINELEWVEDKIYANIYQKDAVAIVNPASGAVEGVINLKGLKNKVTKHPKLDVLNGIAYKGEKNILYITGKNWDKLFKIEVTE